MQSPQYVLQARKISAAENFLLPTICEKDQKDCHLNLHLLMKEMNFISA